jgi:hypothetical protein
VIKRGGGRLGYQTCYFDSLRSPGKPPLWWTSSITKTGGFLTKVKVVGFSIVMQDLVIFCWDLHNYKSCITNPIKLVLMWRNFRTNEEAMAKRLDRFFFFFFLFPSSYWVGICSRNIGFLKVVSMIIGQFYFWCPQGRRRP